MKEIIEFETNVIKEDGTIAWGKVRGEFSFEPFKPDPPTKEEIEEFNATMAYVLMRLNKSLNENLLTTEEENKLKKSIKEIEDALY